MSIMTILSHTPIWIWVLLAFLIKRGVSALSDREMRIERLFILPVIFLVWGIWGLKHEFSFNGSSLTGMAAGLVIGVLIGWLLWMNQPRLRNKPGSEIIIKPGSVLPLIQITLTFVVKYCMAVWLSLNPQFHSSIFHSLQFGLITGVLDGIFWGATLNLFLSWRKTTEAGK